MSSKSVSAFIYADGESVELSSSTARAWSAPEPQQQWQRRSNYPTSHSKDGANRWTQRVPLPLPDPDRMFPSLEQTASWWITGVRYDDGSQAFLRHPALEHTRLPDGLDLECDAQLIFFNGPGWVAPTAWTDANEEYMYGKKVAYLPCGLVVRGDGFTTYDPHAVAEYSRKMGKRKARAQDPNTPKRVPRPSWAHVHQSFTARISSLCSGCCTLTTAAIDHAKYRLLVEPTSKHYYTNLKGRGYEVADDGVDRLLNYKANLGSIWKPVWTQDLSNMKDSVTWLRANEADIRERVLPKYNSVQHETMVKLFDEFLPFIERKMKANLRREKPKKT